MAAGKFGDGVDQADAGQQDDQPGRDRNPFDERAEDALPSRRDGRGAGGGDELEQPNVAAPTERDGQDAGGEADTMAINVSFEPPPKKTANAPALNR